MTKLIYNYDEDGFYTSSSKATIDPLESKYQKCNVYLLPRNATFSKVLPDKKDKLIKWDKINGKWFYEDIKKNILNKTNNIKSQEEKIAELKDKAIHIILSYLSLTDWYIIREYEQPNSCPKQIKENRIIARKQINKIKQISGFKESNLIEINYPFKVKINL